MHQVFILTLNEYKQLLEVKVLILKETSQMHLEHIHIVKVLLQMLLVFLLMLKEQLQMLEVKELIQKATQQMHQVLGPMQKEYKH